MSRRRKKQNQQKKEAKAPYYRAKSLTVGMLEDMCKEIQDKAVIVQISDRHGAEPEKALFGAFILGNRNVREGLVLAGKFSWTGGDEHDEGYNDDDEEADAPFDPDVVSKDVKTRGKAQCNLDEIDYSCVPTHEGVAFLVPRSEVKVNANA